MSPLPASVFCLLISSASFLLLRSLMPGCSVAETMEIVAEERVSAHPMVIGGELVQSSEGLSDPVINPATGEAFDYVPHGTREDLDRAVDAAAEAFKTWSTTPYEERAACMLKFAELVEAKADELAKAMTMEQGKPLVNSEGEVAGISSKCREFVEIGNIEPETVSEDADAEYKLVYTPRGVIGGSVPPTCAQLPQPPPARVPLTRRVSASAQSRRGTSRWRWRRTSCCPPSSRATPSSSSPPPTPRSPPSCSRRWPPRPSPRYTSDAAPRFPSPFCCADTWWFDRCRV